MSQIEDTGEKLAGTHVEPQAPPPPLPTILSPAPMPTPNSDEVRAAKRRSLAVQAARRGRVSTILTDDDNLGGA